MKVSVKSSQNRQVVDITDDIQSALPKGHNGLATATVLHTTAAITTAEASPDTNADLLAFLGKLTPEGVKWQHSPGSEHASDHFLAALIGPSVTLPVEAGRLSLGTWQRVVLIELDGPKSRQVFVSLN